MSRNLSILTADYSKIFGMLPLSDFNFLFKKIVSDVSVHCTLYTVIPNYDDQQ